MKKKYIVLIIIIIVSALLYRSINKELEIMNNKMTTIGKIIRLQPGFKARFYIEYTYIVKGKKYKGTVRVSSNLKCDNGIKYCIGEEFKVSYSSKNPENSRIHLGKYEKYKSKVEFIKFE
ncbi:DUF3592 domain-containing protein [uncultured Polaribacter sp.]|uniref:DUF3592 domain-containing protein n=1 Tax=uncultured Polaribacter sp. TaxID=174711 RepID=UPI00261F706E|nr:DUF3592 domain-containing protein [uncultured Polaribacter sp.]